MERQYLLSNVGHLTKQDTDNMSVFEIDNWFKILKDKVANEQKN